MLEEQAVFQVADRNQRPNDSQINWIDALVAADAVVVVVVDAVEMEMVLEEMFIAVGRLAEDVVVVVVVVVDVVVVVVEVVVWVVAVVDVWNLWWMLLNSCFKMESALKFYNHIHQFISCDTLISISSFRPNKLYALYFFIYHLYTTHD